MPSQTRNWVLFFLSFVVILVGYNWYHNWRWPPAWQPSQEDRIAGEHLARMLTAVTGTGLDDAVQLGVQAAVTRAGAGEYALATAKEKAEKLAAAKPPEPVKPKQPVKPAETVALGGDDYYLSVTLTNRGAGVHDLTLTPFDAADSYGRPALDANGKPLPLRLIPPSDTASFAIYHYATADKDETRPLDTLGIRDWQIVENKKNGDEQRVVFATELADFGVRIVKTFTLRPREYHLGLTVRIERLPDVKEPKPFRYQIAGGRGLPIEGIWYTTVFRNALFDWVNESGTDERNLIDNRAIAATSGGDRIPQTGPRLQYAAVANQYFASAIVMAEDQNFIKFVRATSEISATTTELLQRLDNPNLSDEERAQKLRDAVPGISPEVVKLLTGPERNALWQRLQVAGLPEAQKERLVREFVPGVGPDALKVLKDPGLTEAEKKSKLLASQIRPNLSDITVRAISDELPLKVGEPVEHKYVLYHGPIKVALLEKLGGRGEISPELAQRYEKTLHLNTLTDYGGYGIWTNAIVFFTNVVHWLISVMRSILPDFHGRDAICIILTTVLVRLAMMPISRRQQASMARTQEAMAKLKPEIAKLTERYKNDLVAKQQAQMELYRKHGVNPAAGLGGCLMLILQMPIFLGLYFALQESFFFRLKPFLWIRNLTAPDMLFWWSEKIPFISEPSAMGSFFYLGPYFNLLPILSLTLMVAQMRWMQPPATDEAMAQQQKMMQYIMIPMFAFLFYKMPSGLCLYFISTTLWGLAERKLLPKKKPAAEPAVVAGNGRPGPRGRGKVPAPPPPGKLRVWWDKLLKEASKK